jgi:hypothetical protein
MRTHLVPFGLLLAFMAGGFALASARSVSPSTPASAGDHHVIFAPLIAQGSSNAQPTVVNDATEATATATATAIPTATPTNTATASAATNTATASATAPTPANCDPEADLTGTPVAGGQGRIANHSATCAYEVGLAAYRAFDKNIGNQQLFDSRTATIQPGQTLDLTVTVPGCATQIDLFYGPLLQSLDGQRYGERLLASWFVGHGYCTPGGTPVPTSTASSTRTPAATPTPTETPEPTPTSGGGG